MEKKPSLSLNNMKYFSFWAKNNSFLLLLIFISFFPLVSLLPEGLPITHDGRDHVARIANFYLSLQDGNLIPRWAGNLNWGYGHPILMFLYPLPSYLGSFFHLVGFSFVDSTKLVFGLAYIASGITAYLLFREISKKEDAFIGAILYQFAPYRFVDMYVRGAIGEHVAFVFSPLVLYFIIRYFKKPSYFHFLGITISMAFLILSHNAISLMTLPFILGCIVWMYLLEKKKIHALLSFIGIGWGFLLAGFFWIPAILEGKYTLRDIVLQDVYLTRFTSFERFIYSPWGYGNTGEFSVGVGIIHLAVLILAMYFLFKVKSRMKEIILGGIILALGLTIFLMTPESRLLWKYLPLIKSFQFPWRLLTVAVFLLSGLGVMVASLISAKNKVILLFFVVIGLILTSKPFWQANGYLTFPETFYSSTFHSTTDTGESAPIWSVRFMESTPDAFMNVVGGDAVIQPLERNTVRHTYKITVSRDARLRENTLYFPNWRVVADGKDLPIQFQDPNERGLITFLLPKGEHMVEIIFQNTKLRTLSELLSLFSLLMLGVLYIGRKKIWQHFQ